MGEALMTGPAHGPDAQAMAPAGPSPSRGADGRATRTAAVIVPDWPLVAARDRHERELEAARSAGEGTGRDARAAAPLVLLDRHRVAHADPSARRAGVEIGMRRRSAQALCPDATVLQTDRENESALFELVAASVDTVAAGVDVLRPGILLLGARGPARHAGGEEALAERIVDAVAELTGWDCSVGIADGPFAALLAARTGRIVRPGRSAEYLAPHPIAALRHAPVGPGWGHRDRAAPGAREKRLDLAETVDLLQRLGIASLGDLAALPATAVADRFGPDIALLHLLSQGREPAPPAMHRPELPLVVETVLETPLERTDQAAFVARPLAEELQEMLVRRGLICTRLRILARTEDGAEMERTWRHDGALSVADVVDRIRWQCDGWVTSARLGTTRTGAITRISLHPLQLMPAGEGAPGLWGSAGEASQRASRAFARAQGLAGEHAVLVPVATGGRLLAEEISLVPWRSEKPPRHEGPWPGSLPRPVPATVLRRPAPIELHDAAGRPVVVTARGLLSAVPVRLRIPAETAEVLAHGALAGMRELAVTAHGAPTVLDERWWSGAGHRAARLQLALALPGEGRASREGRRDLADGADGASELSRGEGALAVLALSQEGAWRLEGIYD
ncbi:DNA polymerase-like protein PA0670 [Brachybacterium nesterenkovii]|uniref:DNA polymerase-like protein PA0670 n=2 Tax=Brachybacterium nesterenkovii TaxID=47847 RepID=A0A1X6X5J5_9MICO|nr:DNA polymerase-like protein PA0670 [Brachybacterium nesterenkovii]